jgi:hypothetical protein
MLPAARFRSVVPLAPFACHLASTAAAQTRHAASVKIGGVKIAGSLVPPRLEVEKALFR